jgi:hypothetical protein
MAKTDIPSKYIIREYYDDDKKLESRWTYNYDIFKNGPILVEEFNLPRKEKKKREKKVASDSN